MKTMILTREELMSRLKDRFGEETDEASLGFIEDITDTYDDLQMKADTKEDAAKLEEMTAKYNDLQKKYRERFFSPEAPVESGDDTTIIEDDEEVVTEKLHFEDLFEEVK